ncbi:hypothetical protein [Nocardia sp. NRRL S-836]|uniref:hypothetical protein n=1 Tax=Nocardia sp. NRRL S-836 TaxID=1519492 RepID=UPI0006AEAD26|nr:hypothetical protein [Nocardia sp. NRRL S-836]KOV89955.1 hypothetical protein ADL03_00720 [Nocardia sp. NRRL S-836]
MSALWVEKSTDHFVVSHPGRRAEGSLLIDEPYVTLDEVGLRLREVVAPLVSRYGVDVAAELIALRAAPAEQRLPGLLRLSEAGAPWDVLSHEVCESLGRGGDDSAILAEFEQPAMAMPNQLMSPDPATPSPVVLDAWLRLHEQGFCFGPHQYSTLTFLRMHDVETLAEGRPDLLTRARSAAAELGLRWPPRGPQPGRRDLPR